MRVLSIPHINQLSQSESGIHTVVRSYFKYGSKFGIDFVTSDEEFDIMAIHAGMGRTLAGVPTVTHLHGLYWTADYHMPNWAYRSNEHIVSALRNSDVVTVPSAWVGETIQRDMHLTPHVIPHGVNLAEWQHSYPKEDYVVGYAKNRAGMDVCNPDFLATLCPRFKNINFYATFAPNGLDNVIVTGVIPHQNMRYLVQRARVFISTTRETFGIAILEALASGTPVLAYRQGGAAETVQHGITGYLAEPDNIDDLSVGLEYCLRHSEQLGANAREAAKRFTWEAAVGKLAEVYELALKPNPPTASIVIPAYNKDKYLERAVNSALAQDYPIERIIIVDNNSTDNTKFIARGLADQHHPRVVYLSEKNQGVAHARNAGIQSTHSKYIACLDADDWLDPQFVGACVKDLEADKSLGLAYTGLTWHNEDGSTGNSAWPTAYDYGNQLRHKNQVPTACVFRRDLWERLGGYRQRYAPGGAGSEDADLWTRMGAIGFGGKKVTDGGLFHYQLGGSVSSDPNYREVDWLAWQPWVVDGLHPFASVAPAVRGSHPVRQYDEPVVSVIIPVGLGHHKYLVDAIDSLESQTFRGWEVIIVDDSGESIPERLYKAYPFAKFISTPGKQGAGYARNRGAEIARAPFLLFLDADDWLHPDCLAKMLSHWGATESAIYTDYIGLAHVEDTSLLPDNLRRDLISHDPKTKIASIRHRTSDFDRNKFEAGIQNPPYLWCNITTFIPKIWWAEVGGFDESMESWEDLAFWYALANAGKCFCRIPEPLLVYRFHTGTRREIGLQRWDYLLNYLQGKYDNKRL